MVFKWKIPLGVSADAAAAELERIYDVHGGIDPKTVVEESRPEGAVLHSLFEWDDAKAAEKYRVTQARFIIRNIVQDEDTDEGKVTVRSFHSTEKAYTPTSVILSDDELRNMLLERALHELEEFRVKYRHLSALARVFEAVDELIA